MLLARRWAISRVWPWAALAVANACWAIGQLVRLVVHDSFGHSLDPSPSDLGTLAWFAGTVIGFVGLVVSRRRLLHQVLVILVTLQTAIALTLTLWVGVLIAVADRHDVSGSARAVAVFGFVVAIALVSLGVTFWPSTRRGSRLLCAFAVASGGSAALTASGFVSTPSWLALAAGVLLCIAFAVQGAATAVDLCPPLVPRWQMSSLRVALSYVPVLVAMSVVVVRFSMLGRSVDAISTVMSALVFVLVIVNQLLYWYESQRLAHEVEAKARTIADAEQHLRSLLDNLGEAVALVDGNGHIVDVNHQALVMAGRSARSWSRSTSRWCSAATSSTVRPASGPRGRTTARASVTTCSASTVRTAPCAMQRPTSPRNAPIRVSWSSACGTSAIGWRPKPHGCVPSTASVPRSTSHRPGWRWPPPTTAV